MKSVFISYAKEDIDAARRIHQDLEVAGHSPWLDSAEILPGQRWAAKIVEAIRQSDYVLTLLSNRYLNKRGYVQKEMRIALEVLEEHPKSKIFIIPARLEECAPEEEAIKELQWVDLFPSWETGLKTIVRTLEHSQSLEKEAAPLRPSKGSLPSVRTLNDVGSTLTSPDRSVMDTQRGSPAWFVQRFFSDCFSKFILDLEKMNDISAKRAMKSEMSPAMDVVIENSRRLPGDELGRRLAKHLIILSTEVKEWGSVYGRSAGAIDHRRRSITLIRREKARIVKIIRRRGELLGEEHVEFVLKSIEIFSDLSNSWPTRFENLNRSIRRLRGRIEKVQSS